MMKYMFVLLLLLQDALLLAQPVSPQMHAHAHNDYEHPRPLLDALAQGFISVEADVHLYEGKLLVSHDTPVIQAKTLEELYLGPLDSLLRVNSGQVYANYTGTFYLMIDFKTPAAATLNALKKTMAFYPALLCTAQACPVKIFISGNRPLQSMIGKGFDGLALDGRPADLGAGFTAEQMPFVSDKYTNWCSWNGKNDPKPGDFDRIRELAGRVHAEGKKLRLWAIPDHALAWEALLDAGVDLINTDRLEALHTFLRQRSK
jgi:hypothetical protein